MNSSDAATMAVEIAASIKPTLAGKGPEIQGAILAELVATWTAGHHPDARQDLLAHWFRTVGELVPLCEEEMGNPWKTT